MNLQKPKNENRIFAFDLLRILCAFLVIVTHTNSSLFKSSTPNEAVWWFSVLWFYLSKIAVPIFVLISGACLLPQTDSPKKSLLRLGRMLCVLILFSYLYFLYDAQVNYGLWPRAIQLGEFLKLLLGSQLTDSFWYLYFYIGLLIMLPFLQRAVHAFSKKALWCFAGLCFLIDSAYPLLIHFVPNLQLTEYVYLPLFSGYLGLFTAGYLLRDVKITKKGIPFAFFILSILLCALLTQKEYERTGGTLYWKFLDDRMHPSLLICIASCAVFLWIRALCKEKASGRIITELSGCAFGIYLLQDLVILLTKNRIWGVLSQKIHVIPTMLLWELAVFGFCLALTWVIRRIPLMRKLL